MTADNDAPIPVGLYEWVRILRRIVMPGTIKFTALMLSTWADPDGTRVRPGNDLLAAALGVSERTVIRHLDELRSWQFIKQVSRGGGRNNVGKATEYRLTIPPDLMDRFTLLPPNGRPEPDSRETPTDSGDTQMSPQSPESPVDNTTKPVDNPPPTVDKPPLENDFQVTKQGVSEPIEVTQLCRTTSHMTTQRTNPTWQDIAELPTHALARAPPLASLPSFNPTTLHTGAHP